jgi:hypothetical protein
MQETGTGNGSRVACRSTSPSVICVPSRLTRPTTEFNSSEADTPADRIDLGRRELVPVAVSRYPALRLGEGGEKGSGPDRRVEQKENPKRETGRRSRWSFGKGRGHARPEARGRAAAEEQGTAHAGPDAAAGIGASRFPACRSLSDSPRSQTPYGG